MSLYLYAHALCQTRFEQSGIDCKLATYSYRCYTHLKCRATQYILVLQALDSNEEIVDSVIRATDYESYEFLQLVFEPVSYLANRPKTSFSPIGTLHQYM